MEIWKPIAGYEGMYAVSNYGRVKSIERTMPHSTFGEWHIGERILKQTLAGPKGSKYLLVWLHSGKGKQKSFRVHRLVAEAFLPKVEGKNIVNHKDFDKTNNKVSNLEWCTYLENTHHAVEHGKFDRAIEKRRKPVLNVETGELFRSIEEACQKYGVTRRSIYQVVNLEKRTSCGYHWRFV